MDLKELSMPGVYRSIEFTLIKLKQQVKEVRHTSNSIDLFCD